MIFLQLHIIEVGHAMDICIVYTLLPIKNDIIWSVIVLTSFPQYYYNFYTKKVRMSSDSSSTMRKPQLLVPKSERTPSYPAEPLVTQRNP